MSAEDLRFTHVHLERWRNFVRVDADLERRVFLVGPNASGKSNFLEAFRFLRDLASVGGGFEEAVARRGGVRGVRSLAARRSPTVMVSVSIGTTEERNRWTYLLEFGADKKGRPLIESEIVQRGDAQAIAPGLEHVVLVRTRDRESDPSLFRQTHLEQSVANKDFREIADFFKSIRYVHTLPQVVRGQGRVTPRADDPYGSDFLEQIGRTNKNVQRARLRRIEEALRIAVPQLRELEFWRDEKGLPHLRGRYEHWRPLGAWQTEEQFSDGTLRLIGLLWAALDKKAGPLLLEEPEQSLHPDIVRFMPQMFARLQRESRRQIFISTHSPDLLRDQGIGLNEVLLLEPQPEGTTVRPASAYEDIVALLEGGLTLADAAVPHTRPKDVQELALFPRES